MSQAETEVFRMLFYFLPVLFQLQGWCFCDGEGQGSGSGEDFRFCADRNQTVAGHVLYDFQKDAISVINTADRLNIRAPFPPEAKQFWYLPRLLGNYRLCLYWYRDTGLFQLRYGIAQNYTLSKQANYSRHFQNETWTANDTRNEMLHNVSYAACKDCHNNSLPSSAGYRFAFMDSGKSEQQGKSVQRRDMEEEIRETEISLKSLESGSKNVVSEDPFLYLQHLESRLGKVAFQGDHKTFVGTAVHANIQEVLLEIPEKLPISIKLKEDQEVHRLQVILPKKVFAQSKHYSHRGEKLRVVVLSASSPTVFQGNNSNPVLGGNVVGISVGNTSVYGLPKEERVSITFWHHLFQRNLTPSCVFWDTGSKAGHRGRWNTSGCDVVRGEGQTTCLCDHLTFFAVLLVSSPDIDHIHHKYLTAVTYFGCIVSAVASLCAIFFFLCSKKKQRDNIVYVHMNLLWAIFLLDMSFLIAIPLAPAGGDTTCKAGAMFLHFGVLACLTWMAIEGYSLYRLVIEVFNAYVKHFLFKLCLVGWGLPLFIVCLIFAIDQSHYGRVSFKVHESTEKYTNATICWITKKEINSVLNLGYLSLVLFFNSLMLATMVREILRLRHQEHPWRYVVMLLGLSCVLGIPWGLVFFAFTSGTFKLVAVYLFTIINSLQGFLIFLWYLSKVLQSRKKSSMQCTTSNSIRLQSNSTSI